MLIIFILCYLASLVLHLSYSWTLAVWATFIQSHPFPCPASVDHKSDCYWMSLFDCWLVFEI